MTDKVSYFANPQALEVFIDYSVVSLFSRAIFVRSFALVFGAGSLLIRFRLSNALLVAVTLDASLT
jgi:hypothetical protein